MIPWWRKILPTLLATLTQKQRYLPDIEWSSNSWVHNIFRVYELIFWRRYGIKAESTSGFSIDEKGNKIEVHQCHSFEASCAQVETVIRAWIRGLELSHVRLVFPQLATPGFRMPSPNGYLFAIAFDAAAGRITTGSATSLSLSQTCTGSNRILFAHFRLVQTTDNLNSITYPAGTSFPLGTQGVKQQNTAGDNIWLYTYLLVSPTTGANNCTANWTTLSAASLSCSSYTGAAQSGQPDATGVLTENAATGGNHTISITVVASNCWMLASNYSQDVNPTGAISPGTLRTTATQFFDDFIDTNGTVGTGAQTIGYTWTAGAGGADHHCIVGCSFAPPASVATVFPVITLPLMNVG